MYGESQQAGEKQDMKPSGVFALVAAGVVIGGGAAAYELAKPSSDPVQVNYVEPATTTQPTTATVTPTTAAPKPAATTTTASTTVAVTSSSTTHKATVRKEANVSTSEPAAQPSASTTPPAPDDPIRSVAPPPIPGNGPQISGDGSGSSGTK